MESNAAFGPNEVVLSVIWNNNGLILGVGEIVSGVLCTYLVVTKISFLGTPDFLIPLPTPVSVP